MPTLTEIQAKGVLGEFDYRIEFVSSEDQTVRAVYGENGTGKTKFLNALNDLFSSGGSNLASLLQAEIEVLSVNTDLGTVRFKRVCGDGVCRGEIEIVSKENEDSRVFKFLLDSSEEGDISLEEDELLDLQNCIRRILGDAIYVRDDRVFNARLAEQSAREMALYYPLPPAIRRRILSEVAVEPLSDLMARLEDQFGRKILDITTGQQDGDAVFSTLAQRVVGAGEDIRASEAREEIEESIERILQNGQALESMRMIQLDSVRDIRSLVNELRLNDRNFPQLLSILEYHFDSIQKRIESLDPIRIEIDNFVKTVNGFLRRKKFTYYSDKGLVLEGRNGRLDDYAMLSSGERHLLTLLAQVALAAPNTTLIIIDEPEISLGLDWQRKILNALINLMPDKNIKLLVASHSMQVTSGLPLSSISNPISRIG